MHSTSEQQQMSTKCLSPNLDPAAAEPEITLSPARTILYCLLKWESLQATRTSAKIPEKLIL